MEKLLKISILLASVACTIAVKPQLTMDQLITNAAASSKAFDFIQNDKTLLVELDINYYKEEWSDIEEIGIARTEKRRRRALSRIKRKGIHGNRWTGAIVPYSIARYFEVDEKEQIHKAMSEYRKHTCLQFKERTIENNYLMFVDGGGCSSFVGMKGGEQEVTLGRGCRHHGIIMHEVGHAMGFHHEQTRPDRDSYVTIQQNNIPPNVYFNFQKYTNAVIKNWGVPYDYSSIMHYGATAFSYNGRPTIVAKQSKYQNVMGNRDGFSFRDVKLLNTMYQCASKCANKPTCPGEAFVDKSCRCICPGKPTKVCSTGDSGVFDGATAVSGTTTSGSSKNCTDVRAKDCPTWKDRGFCATESYKDFMKLNCRKTCEHCEVGGGEECTDIRENDCPSWKDRGFCTTDSYKDFMTINCRKTCEYCQTGAEECNDQKTDCKAWADRGYCQNTYVAYMRTNCPKSCGICSDAAKACKDNNQKCYVWAYVGECQRNSVWMKANCKKSCNTCEGKMMNPVSDCVDMNNHCGSWSQQGECNKNPAYMHNYCKKSCNRCGAMGDYSADAQCKDSNRYCRQWAERGECRKNPLYMNDSCKKSCGRCAGGSNTASNDSGQASQGRNCRDKSRHCRYWERTNQCRLNPAYMLPNCPKSCRRC